MQPERRSRHRRITVPLFRLGIACLIVVVILDVIVAAALFTPFAPVNRMVSAMAAVVSGSPTQALYLVAISQLVIALQLLADPDQALGAIDAYDTIWQVGLILFGVHLLLIGFLAYRSGFVPKDLRHPPGGRRPRLPRRRLRCTVMVQNYSISIGAFTFVGEVALIFWLLISGSRNDFSRDRPTPARHRSILTLCYHSPGGIVRRRKKIMNRKLTAILLIAAAVLTNAAFTVLGTVFNYPDVLSEPVEEILAAFRASRPPSCSGSR